MDMQIVAVPLYSKEMAVEAYVFRYGKGNALVAATQTTSLFDGASRNQSLEVLDLVGLEAFTLDKPIFVPITNLNLLGNLSTQCKEPVDKVIFLFEDPPPTDPLYVGKILELAEKGYRFAVSNLEPKEKYDAVLKVCSHIFLSMRPERIETSERILAALKRQYRNIQAVATHIRSNEMMSKLSGKGYILYESRFFKVPITKGDTGVSPLKANSIRLMNTVQNEEFEFENVTAIVQGDPALTISLLRIVNAPANSRGKRSEVKSIAHAVAMLGQKEVRRWVTTAVSQSLGNDRPNEITKISLVRARFAENLAPLYDMAHMSQGLFLMGLFSVLDIILEVPMTDALKMVQVSDDIRKALVDSSGIYYPVLNMIVDYESAYWSSVSRQMIVHDIKEEDLSDAYINALIWYKSLIIQEPEEENVAAGEAEPQEVGSKY